MSLVPTPSEQDDLDEPDAEANEAEQEDRADDERRRFRVCFFGRERRYGRVVVWGRWRLELELRWGWERVLRTVRGLGFKGEEEVGRQTYLGASSGSLLMVG